MKEQTGPFKSEFSICALTWHSVITLHYWKWITKLRCYMYVHPIELYTDISSKNMILKTLIHNTAVHVIYSKVSGQFSQTIHCNKQALSLELFLLNPVLWHYNKQAFCMWGGSFPIRIFILWLFFRKCWSIQKMIRLVNNS